jgi:hypothetical protein
MQIEARSPLDAQCRRLVPTQVGAEGVYYHGPGQWQASGKEKSRRPCADEGADAVVDAARCTPGAITATAPRTPQRRSITLLHLTSAGTKCFVIHAQLVLHSIDV